MDLIIKQNSKGLNPDIQAVGCFFVSALAIAQMHSNKNLTKAQYNKLWELAHARKYMKNRNMVVSAKVINLAFDELGVRKWATEVGTSLGGYYVWVRDNPSYQRVDACIQKIRQPKGSRYPMHFRVTNINGELLFDPYSPEIKSARSEYTIWYCIKDY
ncbi:MAG: hypothetical protein P1P64_03410 [Treponemataceae bacterium]